MLRRVCFVIAGAALLAVIGSHSDELQACAIGLGSGALIAAIALSTLLTYRGSGIINFAAGGTAMYAAYFYQDLRTNGRLLLPPLPNPLALIEGISHQAGGHLALPHWPTQVAVATPTVTTNNLGIQVNGAAMGMAPAMFLTLVACAVFGLVLYWLVFRPLRTAPPLAAVVASVGVLVLQQATIILRFSSSAIPVGRILPDHTLNITSSLSLPEDQLLLASIVVVVAITLWAFFRFSRFGLASRAAAEAERGAMSLGYSVNLLGGTNWIIASVLAGALGVLAAPVNRSIDPATIPFLIVPALGAALIGRLRSFTPMIVAALAIGALQSWLNLIVAKSWFPHTSSGTIPGLADALPFVIILVVLALREHSLPERGAPANARLPKPLMTSRLALNATVTVPVVAAAILMLSSAWRLAITNSLIGVAFCLSIVVVTGLVGQISLAQLTIAGVGGFVLSKLATTEHVPFPFGLLLGAVAAVVISLLIGVVALRIRGVNLAILSLAAAVAIQDAVLQNPSLSGPKGARVAPPGVLGFAFGPNNQHWGLGDGKLPSPFFGLLCLAVVALLALLVANVRRSATGQRMLAVRSNERAAAGAGVNVTATKLLAFVLAAFIAGIAGGLSGYRFGAVDAAYFGAFSSVTFVAFAYLGGISSVSGAVLGGLLVASGVGSTAMQQWFGIKPSYSLFLGGLGVIVTTVANPEGLAGALDVIRSKMRSRLMSERRNPSPGPQLVDVHRGASE